MASITFDTLTFAQKLRDAGLPPEQAEAHAEALKAALDEEVATKRDLKEMEINLKREVAEMKADVLKWLIGLLFLQAGFIVAFISCFDAIITGRYRV